jgi:hypothetical protein
MGFAVSIIVAFTIVTTIVLLVLAYGIPAATTDSASGANRHGEPRIRLLFRLLFSRTQPDGITLDCLLVSVEEAAPGVHAPEGLPFTLRLRVPDTVWFAHRVDQLLGEWADDGRELLIELTEDHGKVRTMIASGTSSVHLELAGAAGLSLTA